MVRKALTGSKMTSSGPYSHAVDGGDYVFFSGQTAKNGADYNGEVYDIATQTHKCFEYLEDVMNVAGVTFDHVVKVNVYLTGMKHFAEMNVVYQEKFSEPYPARTCVAVLELPLGADVEIEVICKR